MLKHYFTTIASTAFLVSSLAFGHGEDKPGPHGGYIRMPGAFHTELIQKSKTSLGIYLLDMEWKNPTAQNSSLTAVFKRKEKETGVNCKPQENHFECQLPKGTRLQAGDQILITAQRQGMTGGKATYDFPLSFASSQHSGH